MTKYLSQRAILENIRASNDSALHAFGELIMNGAFDVDVSTFGFVQEKDAEISKLKQALSLQCDDTLKERQEVIRLRQEENIRRMNSSVPARDPKQDSVYQRLERLEDQQKRILGDLNEAYPAGTIRKTTGAKIKELDRRIEALEKGASYVLKVKEEKPAEPEMVICPHSNTCGQVDCNHKTPHHETPHCQSFCEYAPCDTSRCIPVKK